VCAIISLPRASWARGSVKVLIVFLRERVATRFLSETSERSGSYVRQRARPDREAGSLPERAGCAAIGTTRVDASPASTPSEREKPCATASVHGMLCVDPTSRKVHRAAVRRVSRETRGRRFTAVVSERESVRIRPRKRGSVRLSQRAFTKATSSAAPRQTTTRCRQARPLPRIVPLSWACSRGVGHLVASARATLAREGLMGGVRARKRAAPAVDAWPESNTVER